jgi:acyl-coenzyme A thioesterase PaaI-like protein
MSSNPLRRYAEKVNHYPAWLSSRLLTWMFRYKVKLAGTARVDIVSTDFSTVTFRQPNYKKVQNHIGSVHAAAMALLAESATGFIVSLNLPGISYR